jgi:hypothetical protein
MLTLLLPNCCFKLLLLLLLQAEDEIASGPGLSDALAAASAGGPTTSESYRKRSSRKPMRGPSNSNMLAQVESLAGVDANLFNSLMRGAGGLASGLRERSGDNTAAAADVVSSGANGGPECNGGGPRRASSAGPARSTGSQPPPGQQQQQRSGPAAVNAGGGSSGGGGFNRSGERHASLEEAVSQEDDSEPVTGSGRKSSSGRGGGSGPHADGLVAVAAAAAAVSGGAFDDDEEEDAPDAGALGMGLGLGGAGQMGEVNGEEEQNAAGMAEEGGGDAICGDDGDGGLQSADCGPPPGPLAPRRVRHVPRQSSAINLATRVGPAELKRMAAEVEALQAENRALRQQAAAAAGGGGAAAAALAAAAAAYEEGEGAGARLYALEREVASMRQQVGWVWLCCVLPGVQKAVTRL